jgi:dTDP-4-dehydrorhamnose reductase
VKKILIVGKRSLLSHNLEKFLKKKYIVTRVSFPRIIKNNLFLYNFNFIINCTFNVNIKDYRKTSDYILANLLVNKKITYIMISSCKVYGTSKKFFFSETIKCKPKSIYGKLKFKIEKQVKKILKKKVVIVRPSNIIQFDIRKEIKIKTFINKILTDLLKKKKIYIPIKNFKKDFLPINFFNDAIYQLIKKNITGIFNIGTGIGIQLEEFAKLLIKGFGRGRIYKVKDHTDNMILNINKLRKNISYNISKNVVEREIIKLGKKLRLYE